MLHAISWSTFIWFLICLIIPYYGYVGMFYYRRELLGIFKNMRLKKADALSGQTKQSDNRDADVHDLLEELKKVFQQALRIPLTREVLLQSIRSKLKRYPGLKNDAIVVDINHHIRMEVLEQFGTTLTDEEISEIWSP